MLGSDDIALIKTGTTIPSLLSQSLLFSYTDINQDGFLPALYNYESILNVVFKNVGFVQNCYNN